MEPVDHDETGAAPSAPTPPEAPRTPRWRTRFAAVRARLRGRVGEALGLARAFALRHGAPLDGIEAALRAFTPRRPAAGAERPAAAYDAHLRFGLVVCVIVVFGFGGWSAFASIRSAVVASGVISTEGQSRTIQHRDGGIVDAILVSDGDHVEAGDVVVRLDATSLRSELAIVENRLYEALARRARLEAERDDAPTMRRPPLLDAMVASDRRWKAMLAGATADPKLVSALNDHAMADIRAESTPETGAEIADRVFSGQVRLFQARRDTLKAQVDRLHASIAQSQEQIKGIDSQRESQERQRDLIQQELVGARALLKKGLIQLPRVLALERQEAELEGGIAGHHADVAAINQSISQLQLQIIEAQRDMREKVLTELREAESNVQDLTEQRVAASDKLSRIDIRAPVSGTVNNMQIHTVGGVVKPADVLMSIVPDREALIVEARVEPQFVDQIRAGQAARIRLSAFDQRTTPELDGKLMTVSADRLTDTATNQPYYALKVSIAQAEIAKLDGKMLVPGMPAEVFLVTGDRTPLSYIMKPLNDQLARSMREQ
ncbi:HlyD family type I secretion periplasmic adaptor subunit [Rhizobiales bacterium Sp-1]|uniref:Membrane fusion protein (MFP) family protein n=2 Tax=Segnochrobactrum spirostomi TaxID=2608987 RepID=A0A6A7XYS7_9HYPH|nr:HlyD family type I secretion periplasmic adaptor subunit [Segnochrobactrum spirostomi]